MPRTLKPLVSITGCPICDSPHHVAYDSEIIAGIASAETTEHILDRVLNVASVLEPRFIVELYQLETHSTKHTLSGTRADARGNSLSVIRFPNGEELIPTDLAGVLSFVIGAGIRNMALSPDMVNATHVLRAVELMKDIKGGGGEMEELLTAIRKQLETPTNKDTKHKDDPYAQDSPVGKV